MEVEAKKWGSSLGIILPKDIVKKERIVEGQKIIVNILSKKITVGDMFRMVEKNPLPKSKDSRSVREVMAEIDKELEPESST
ncbi:MAG: AbrB/MazE/SpoVT family DNA-binding domain-containing protein [Nanoarchaeota archaeon]